VAQGRIALAYRIGLALEEISSNRRPSGLTICAENCRTLLPSVVRGLATAVGEAMARNSVSKHSSTIRGDESNFCINPNLLYVRKCISK
jgi:hypothetical protein